MWRLWLLLCWGPGGGLVGIVIGKTRARHPLASFVIGFVLGPIGWLILAFGFDNRRKCAACLGPIVAGATRCRHCGHELTLTAAERLGRLYR